MEHSRDRATGGSINSPPWFEGGCEKYTQWKIYMKSYLYAQDEHVWNIVENGWSVPMTKAKEEGASTTTPKPRKDWTEEEVRNLQADFKAKNSIFTALSEREKLRISHCETAKQAWDLLQITYEGNKKVRAQKLQALIFEFETMTMADDETVDDFHGRILKISGQCRSLGAPFDEDKIVKKILRALPEKFHSKVTSIEDSFDIDDYPLDELIGNLKTYEMRLKPEKKNKGVAFKAVKEIEEEEGSLDLALLTKEFKKFLKSKNSSKNTNAPRRNNYIGSGNNSDYNSKNGRGNFKGNHSGKPKCYECGGFGHISTDCGNRKLGNSNNKSLLSTWSDDESQEIENVALVSSLLPDSESDEYFSDDDETNVRCKQLYKASKATLIRNLSLEKEVDFLRTEKEKVEKLFESSQSAWKLEKSKLVSESADLQGDQKILTWKTEKNEYLNKIKLLELDVKGQRALNLELLAKNESLQHELKLTQERFMKFDISSTSMSKLLGSGKAPHDTCGLGYTGEDSKSTKFVRASKPSVEQIDVSLDDHVKSVREGNSNQHHQVKLDQESPTGQHSKIHQRSHIEATCLVALTAFADKRRDFWYVDSGCSRHMTGDKTWFTSFEDENTSGSVTFGDGRKANILARGTVNTPGIPNLKNVLFVEGLTANLISVSHLADDYEDVWFNKQRCLVLNQKGEGIMGGMRSVDNCYHIQANESSSLQSCLSVKSTEETFELWHRKMGHINYQDLLKLSSKQCVRGLPNLKGKTDKMCGDCKVGKQTKAPHRMVNSATTSQVLELLHMDLMGPAQSESLGGKSYILVVVDDFSRYTWVNFLKDKTETFESFKNLSQKLIIEKQSSNNCLVRIRSDNGTEFKNASFSNYCHELGVSHEFSAPITPQQNGIVERKNRVLLDMARVLLHAAGLSKNFWAEAISTACYTINRVFLRPGNDQTAYELWKGSNICRYLTLLGHTFTEY
ncbi:uncharacterized protein LOC121050018 [Rosa chinensis]|uniref:uncharacterized protein LOC121049960 n=1 Tax=Rosa chinensis TaxID=74649 RepID=UPI001AD8D304|nr:uncharacterized protein LOC121049960 [Rosa chinensis]XP_040364484.1 uncharacterized protein LOC121050018 [Rosa chinensis]